MHTERLDADWIVRFVRFHGIRSRSNNLSPAEPTIEAFLHRSGGAWKRRCRYPEPGDECPDVSPQPLLRQALPGSINAVRRQEDQRPVVMTREEVATVTSPLYGTAPLVA
jgi:hypothetical protein